MSLFHSPVIYCDNVGATSLYSNPVFHSRMKHVAIDFHFIRDQVQSGSLRVAHVSSKNQLDDALTKPLSRTVTPPIPIRPDWRIRTEVRGARLSIYYLYTILYCTGTLIDLFFFRAVPVPMGIQTISVNKKNHFYI